MEYKDAPAVVYTKSESEANSLVQTLKGWVIHHLYPAFRADFSQPSGFRPRVARHVASWRTGETDGPCPAMRP